MNLESKLAQFAALAFFLLLLDLGVWGWKEGLRIWAASVGLGGIAMLVGAGTS